MDEKNIAPERLVWPMLGWFVPVAATMYVLTMAVESQQIRVLQSHELGHNFNALHDPPGGTIMAPSVNGSNVWSSASKARINGHISSSGCLGILRYWR